MKKQTIAVDIDEVLFPMVTDLIDYLDRAHKIKLTEADFKDYYFENIWTGDPAEAAEIFNKYKDQLSVEVAPLAGAREALKKLSGDYNIVVITSRGGSFEQSTRQWLDTHFPEIFKEVHLLGEDDGIHNIQFLSKTEICQKLGVRYLIDDMPKHIEEITKIGVKGLLFGNYSWNKTEELTQGVTRVKDWQAVLEYFDGRG